MQLSKVVSQMSPLSGPKPLRNRNCGGADGRRSLESGPKPLWNRKCGGAERSSLDDLENQRTHRAKAVGKRPAWRTIFLLVACTLASICFFGRYTVTRRRLPYYSIHSSLRAEQDDEKERVTIDFDEEWTTNFAKIYPRWKTPNLANAKVSKTFVQVYDESDGEWNFAIFHGFKGEFILVANDTEDDVYKRVKKENVRSIDVGKQILAMLSGEISVYEFPTTDIAKVEDVEGPFEETVNLPAGWNARKRKELAKNVYAHCEFINKKIQNPGDTITETCGPKVTDAELKNSLWKYLEPEEWNKQQIRDMLREYADKEYVNYEDSLTPERIKQTQALPKKKEKIKYLLQEVVQNGKKEWSPAKTPEAEKLQQKAQMRAAKTILTKFIKRPSEPIKDDSNRSTLLKLVEKQRAKQ